jgi:cell division protein FtsL
LRAALDAKVAALTAAEDQLLQERTACQGAEGRLQQEQAALADARSALERKRVAREASQMSLEDRNVEFSKVEGELMVLSITSASWPSRSKARPSGASSRRSRPGAAPSKWRGSKSKVGRCSTPVLLVFP